MTDLVREIMREVGTPECVLLSELPRRTGLSIDPNEVYDLKPVVALLRKLTDLEILSRRNTILSLSADTQKEYSGGLYEYAILLRREMNGRKMA